MAKVCPKCQLHYYAERNAYWKEFSQRIADLVTPEQLNAITEAAEELLSQTQTTPCWTAARKIPPAVPRWPTTN